MHLKRMRMLLLFGKDKKLVMSLKSNLLLVVFSSSVFPSHTLSQNPRASLMPPSWFQTMLHSDPGVPEWGKVSVVF